MSDSGIISHLIFIVHNLDRTARLLVEGLGARELQDSGNRQHSRSLEKFVELGGVWIASMEGEPLSQHSYRHVALAVEAGKLPASRARLEALDVEVRPARPRSEGERDFLYVHDLDNYLSDLHAGAPDRRLQADRAGHNPTVQPKGPDWGRVSAKIWFSTWCWVQVSGISGTTSHDC